MPFCVFREFCVDRPSVEPHLTIRHTSRTLRVIGYCEWPLAAIGHTASTRSLRIAYS
jgi:hypothetical protein